MRLQPLVKAPVLDFSHNADDFQLRFTPLDANTSFIERLSTDATPSWEIIPGQTGISGPAEYLFSTPLSEGRGIFRVGAEAKYTQVTID